MTVFWIVCGVLFVAWVLMNLKTSRPDGTLIGRLHPYRKMMFYLMQGRNESIVYFDNYVRAEKLLAYLARAREKFPVDITHCLVGAAAVGLAEVPRMNQFVMGRRLYQRNQRVVSFSMKRKQKDREAKLSVARMVVAPARRSPSCASASTAGSTSSAPARRPTPTRSWTSSAPCRAPCSTPASASCAGSTTTTSCRAASSTAIRCT